MEIISPSIFYEASMKAGSAYEGQWQNGKRHGLGVESRGRWMYRGEWTQGFKGRYGVRQSSTSNAKYEGTWANGLQDGYGSETYADGGTYQGQWLRGMRHGYGVRASAPFGQASHYRPGKALRASLTSLRSAEGGNEAADRDRRVDDSRGGFVLKARSDEAPVRRQSLVEKSSNIKKSILSKIRKQRSTGDLEKRGTSGGSIRSTGSSASWVSTESSQSGVTSGSMHTDSNASFVVEDEHMDASVTETYLGEWKNDKRSGFGISERSDGLKYEGEWFNNKKYGYGVTTFRDGSKEEGKYKNNVLITSQKKKHLFLIRSAKFRERIDAAVNAAQRASKFALQKADIAISRTATARGKAEMADLAADQAREDFEVAQGTAKQFAPDFVQPGLEKLRNRGVQKYKSSSVEDAKVRLPPNQKAPSLSRETSLPNTPSSAPPVANKAPSLPPYENKPHVQLPYDNRPQLPTQQVDNKGHLPQQQPPQQGYPSHLTNATVHNPGINVEPQENYHHMVTPPTPQPPHDKDVVQNEQPQQPNLQPRATIRRNSKQLTGESPSYNFQQAMSDHFDHYKRPPSRDSSVDRYSRKMGPSRQSSVDKVESPGSRAPSVVRGVTPVTPSAVVRGGTPNPMPPSTNLIRGSTPTSVRAGTPATGNGSVVGAAVNPTPPPFEDVIMRKRGLGQDIIPSASQPKRTESLYVTPQKKEPVPKSIPVTTNLQRKKSLPDVQGYPKVGEAMSREEVSVLSSARREELRKMQEESEKLRANPLLYLVSPHVKEWFSRQQLVMLVLFVNISLAIMFFKLLT
ncbi:junctophilin-1 isoform X2 [Halyomorpha halys]|uniref:junctophilin-1 isoform X2 n=1 Tax=Halyomorpha halys TaxID=286706 RepID=UPI0034D1D9C7